MSKKNTYVKENISTDSDIKNLLFANSKRYETRYRKYTEHLTYEVVMEKMESESFWRNCLILHMASSGVPRFEISNFMGISISRINEIITNTKYNLFTSITICPLYHTKQIKWTIEQHYLKSHKFKFSAMELCRDTAETVLSCDSYHIRQISAGLKLSKKYWEEIQEKHSGYYLIP